MKRLFTIAIVAFSMYSCGDAGIGFNVAKEVGVDADMSIPSTPAAGDVPEREEPVSFNLEDVSSDIDDLGEVVINSISYEITASEEMDIDELSATFSTPAGDIEFFNLQRIENTNGKVVADLSPSQLDAIRDEVFNLKRLNGDVLLDLVDFPDTDLDVVVTTYFDVTVKIRE